MQPDDSVVAQAAATLVRVAAGGATVAQGMRDVTSLLEDLISQRLCNDDAQAWEDYQADPKNGSLVRFLLQGAAERDASFREDLEKAGQASAREAQVRRHLNERIKPWLSRIRGPWLYEHLKGPAQGVKVFLQMIVGVVGATIVIVAAIQDIPGQPAIMVEHHALAIIAASLAVAASLELAYTLFTPGPDEAVDPLMLGLSAVFLYLVSKLENLTWTTGISALLFAATLAILFGVRQRFIGESDVRKDQSARLDAVKDEVRKAMGESQVRVALDVLVVAEFAWHDRYQEIGIPDSARREILRGSQGRLDSLIALIKTNLEDREALPQLRGRGGEGMQSG